VARLDSAAAMASVRSGRHALTEYDWQQYMDFADRHFGRSEHGTGTKAE